jgi:hypothetical protein
MYLLSTCRTYFDFLCGSIHLNFPFSIFLGLQIHLEDVPPPKSMPEIRKSAQIHAEDVFMGKVTNDPACFKP